MKTLHVVALAGAAAALTYALTRPADPHAGMFIVGDHVHVAGGRYDMRNQVWNFAGTTEVFTVVNPKYLADMMIVSDFAGTMFIVKRADCSRA